MKKIFGVVIITLLALLTAGCMNYEQETFLKEDLSGHINILISISPKEFISNLLSSAAEKINSKTEPEPPAQESMSKATASLKCDIKEEEFLRAFNTENMKNVSFKKEEKDGIVNFYFSADFDDIRKMYADAAKISITEDKSGFVTYKESFSSEDAGTIRPGDADSYGPDLFKGYYFRYIMHMPRGICSANTDKVDKNTATWFMPMPDAMRQKDFMITVTIEPLQSTL